MKAIREVEVTICDVCGEIVDFASQCLGCGKHICYDCRGKGAAVKYEHGVYSSGSGDGLFCTDCQLTPPTEVKDLLAAYRTVQALRVESQAKCQDFEDRTVAAEGRVKSLYNLREQQIEQGLVHPPT